MWGERRGRKTGEEQTAAATSSQKTEEFRCMSVFTCFRGGVMQPQHDRHYSEE